VYAPPRATATVRVRSVQNPTHRKQYSAAIVLSEAGTAAP
jgi:hypothetical protein